MKNKLIKITTMAVAAGIALGAALPAFAIGLGTNANLNVAATAGAGVTSGGANVKLSAKASAAAAADARITDRADREITRRINALNALTARVNDMQKLSADQKTSLASSIQAQIATLTDLQAKITADASDTVALRADAQSITSSYRIFALILPQGAIIAASDRVITLVDQMTALGEKLQARIASSTGMAGFNVTTTAAAMADFSLKVTDAQTQAQAAANEVAALQPDMGSKTTQAANLTALKDARSKIQAAQKDLVAARKDAGAVVKAVTALKVSANENAEASSSVSGTAR